MLPTVRDLLNNRAISLRSVNIENTPYGFSCIGIAERIPELGTSMKREVYIWHVSSGLLPLTEQELERWGVDAPDGRHWILSERKLPDDLSPLSDLNVEIWGPDKVSTWIGEAVLSGELIAQTPDEVMDQLTLKTEASERTTKPISLKPLIEISNWLAHRGLEGASFTPVLLDARMWLVSGYLEGPNGELEHSTQTVTEDPWSSNLSILDLDDTTIHSPELLVISPPESSWLSDIRLSSQLFKLLEVRRKENIEDTNQSGHVRGMLLQTWSFKAESSDVESHPIHIPGWIVQIPEEKILHGRNGRIYDPA